MMWDMSTTYIGFGNHNMWQYTSTQEIYAAWQQDQQLIYFATKM